MRWERIILVFISCLHFKQALLHKKMAEHLFGPKNNGRNNKVAVGLSSSVVLRHLPIITATSLLCKLNRAVFNWVSKVVCVLLWFCFTSLCDWLQNLAPLSRPIRKLKPNMTCSHAFSCAWHQLNLFALSSDWFIGQFAFVVIGRGDYFGFGFMTLIWKAL